MITKMKLLWPKMGKIETDYERDDKLEDFTGLGRRSSIRFPALPFHPFFSCAISVTLVVREKFIWTAKGLVRFRDKLSYKRIIRYLFFTYHVLKSIL